MVGAVAVIPASANTLPNLTGRICEGNMAVIYTTDGATENLAWGMQRPTSVGVVAPAQGFTPPFIDSDISGGAVVPFINESQTSVLAGADPAGVKAGGMVGWQDITGAVPSPADFTRDATMGPITWEMCTLECCGAEETTPEESGTPSCSPEESGSPSCSPSPSGDPTCTDFTPEPTTTVPVQTPVVTQPPVVVTPPAVTTPPAAQGNPRTGVAIAVIPTLIAAAAAITVAKKRK